MVSSSPLAKFVKWEKEIPGQIFLRQPFNGVWKTWTWAQAGEEARRLAAGLHSTGLQKGDHVAILSKNCAQWIIADLAIMMAGCISIPVYPSLSAAAIKPILIHSDSKAIILGKLDNFATQVDGIPPDIFRISVTDYGTKEQYSMEDLIANNEPLQVINTWNADDILTIIYTSGTTGNSKGVMHTVLAFDMVVPMVAETLKLPLRPRLFSYLPMSHIAERMAIEMYGIYFGAAISFAESIEAFPKNLEDTKPDLFFAVPRIWGKLREGILKKLPQKKLDLLLSIPLVSRIIKNRIRKKLGLSKASHIYSSAAPLSPDIQKWFINIGINLRQAYGMTEDCVYAHFDTPAEFRIGRVGMALPGLMVKFAADGELLVKSKSNMIGYYKEPGLTAAAFDEEKYLKTGDIAEYDADGFLAITGRVKDLFKTDKGKYIAPSPIEMHLLANAKIEQVCVVGTGVPQPIALVTLSEEGKKIAVPELVNEFIPLLKSINNSLEVFEKLEKLVIMADNWTVENGMLTPTLKVKRNEIEKIHLPKYPGWYTEKNIIVWEK
jgi:long-chain acyl-CoA synthetase